VANYTGALTEQLLRFHRLRLSRDPALGVVMIESKTCMRNAKLAAITLSSTAFFLLLILGWPHKTTGQVTLQVTGIRPAGTNVVQVSVTLSNAASRSLNIVDAVDGHPAYHIQPHPDMGLKYGFTLARMANKLKINLVTGATLSDSFLITNPPSRFRIKVPIRDPAAEVPTNSALLTGRMNKVLVGLHIIKPPDPEFHSLVPPATSDWLKAELH